MDSPVAGWAEKDKILRACHATFDGLREGHSVVCLDDFEAEDGFRLKAASLTAKLTVLGSEGLLGRPAQAGVTLTLVVRVEFPGTLGA